MAAVSEVCFSLVDLYPQYLFRRYVTQGLNVLRICLRHITRVNALPLYQPCRLPAMRYIFRNDGCCDGMDGATFP